MQTDLEIKVEMQAGAPSRDGPMALLGSQFEQLYGMVYGYLLHRFFDRELAEELTAETFYKAAASHRRLPAHTKQMQVWLLRTATNLANTHYRQTRLRRFVFERFARTASGATVSREANEADSDQRVTHMRDVLSVLPPKYQAVVVLRYYMELPFQEIGEILGCSPSAVRMRLSRATKEIRRRLRLQNNAE